MKKIVLTFGFIAGGILAGMMVATLPLLESPDFDHGEVLGYTTMVVAFLMVFFGIRSYRENIGDGTVTFGRGFTVGILITLIACACYVATWEVINYTLMPDFVDKYSAHVIEKQRQSGADAASLAATRKEMDRFRELYSNPFINVAFTFAEVFPVGLLATAISAAILRRRPTALMSPSV
jgi:hypothetical protein